MDVIGNVSRAIKNPRYYVPRYCSKLNQKYHKSKYQADHFPDGVDIFDEDWDNLVILDACRYDYFEQSWDLPGTLERKISKGTSTPEFARGNLRDVEAYDTVYVSGNGYIFRLKDELGYEFHKFVYINEREAFRNRFKRAETITEHALEAGENYPNKRVIAHYIQPHQPYFSAEGDELFEFRSRYPYDLKNTELTQERIRDAYQSNLEYVLTEVERLLDALSGKTVITSDHGELLGERLSPIPVRRYEHTDGLYVDELHAVPWLEYPPSERKDVIAERTDGDNFEIHESDDNEYTDVSEDVKEELKAMGYL